MSVKTEEFPMILISVIFSHLVIYSSDRNSRKCKEFAPFGTYRDQSKVMIAYRSMIFFVNRKNNSNDGRKHATFDWIKSALIMDAK